LVAFYPTAVSFLFLLLEHHLSLCACRFLLFRVRFTVHLDPSWVLSFDPALVVVAASCGLLAINQFYSNREIWRLRRDLDVEKGQRTRDLHVVRRDLHVEKGQRVHQIFFVKRQMMGQFKKDIEKVKAAVTEQVTKEVTERVTKEVMERVTKEVTARMDKKLTEFDKKLTELDEIIRKWRELSDENKELRKDKNRLTNRNGQLEMEMEMEKEKEKIQKELDLTGEKIDIPQTIYNLQGEVVNDVNKLLPERTKAFTKLEHAREYHGAFDRTPSISINGWNVLHDDISAVTNAPANSYVHGNRPLIQENKREAFRMLNDNSRKTSPPVRRII
jgi:hypothetical protein